MRRRRSGPAGHSWLGDASDVPGLLDRRRRLLAGSVGHAWLGGSGDAPGLRDRRRVLVATAQGAVLDIGAGTELSLAHYRPGQVDSVVALEPDLATRGRLAGGVAAATVPVEVRSVAIDEADLPEAGFATVVATLALCSVADPARTAASIAHCLAPGGRLLFIEHVAALGVGGRLQRAVTPLWSRATGGCHLDRDTLGILRRAGLSVSDCDRFALPGLGHLAGSWVAGVAWRRPIGDRDPVMSVLAGAASPQPGGNAR